jgi:hypothetical protein
MAILRPRDTYRPNPAAPTTHASLIPNLNPNPNAPADIVTQANSQANALTNCLVTCGHITAVLQEIKASMRRLEDSMARLEESTRGWVQAQNGVGVRRSVDKRGKIVKREGSGRGRGVRQADTEDGRCIGELRKSLRLKGDRQGR